MQSTFCRCSVVNFCLYVYLIMLLKAPSGSNSPWGKCRQSRQRGMRLSAKQTEGECKTYTNRSLLPSRLRRATSLSEGGCLVASNLYTAKQKFNSLLIFTIVGCGVPDAPLEHHNKNTNSRRALNYAREAVRVKFLTIFSQKRLTTKTGRITLCLLGWLLAWLLTHYRKFSHPLSSPFIYIFISIPNTAWNVNIFRHFKFIYIYYFFL